MDCSVVAVRQLFKSGAWHVKRKTPLTCVKEVERIVVTAPRAAPRDALSAANRAR
jgi:hypothetical protein